MTPPTDSARSQNAESAAIAPRAVVLVGLRCTGKSTVGRELAQRLAWAFVDADDELARAVGQPAGDYLRTAGEPAFRAAEERVLVPLLASVRATVVATGGGAPTIPAVRAALAAEDLCCVWLQADPAVLVRRLASGEASRPALTDRDPAAEIAQLWREREPHYAAVARFSLDTSAAEPKATVAAIVDAVLASE